MERNEELATENLSLKPELESKQEELIELVSLSALLYWGGLRVTRHNCDFLDISDDWKMDSAKREREISEREGEGGRNVILIL